MFGGSKADPHVRYDWKTATAVGVRVPFQCSGHEGLDSASKCSILTSSAGNILSPVPMPNLHVGWCLKLSEKKELYRDMRMAVGGASDSGDVEALTEARTDLSVEPVWHNMSEEVFVELVASETAAAAVIDWCPMDTISLCLPQT